MAEVMLLLRSGLKSPEYLLINFQKEISCYLSEEAQSRLLNIRRSRGERNHIEENQGALCDGWQNVAMNEAILNPPDLVK